MYVCSGGEEKRKAKGVNRWWGKKEGNKKEKRNGEWGLHVWWDKRESGKERRKKKI